MTLRAFSVLTLAVMTILPNVMAQEDGERRRRERDRGQGGERSQDQRGPGGMGRGFGMGPGGGMMGMFGGMSGAMGGGGANQLLGLLRMEDVRKEVGMSDEVYEAVQARQRESFTMMRELGNASDERRKEVMEEINTSAQELIDEVLPPAKQKRLLGLFVQFARGPAVLNPQVSKELALSKETTETIQKDLEAFGSKMRDRFMSMQGGGGFPDMAKIQEELESTRKELDELILSKLSDEQKKQLESIKGEKFEFPDMMGMMQGGFGRGDRPPRGDGDQAPGRGRRGGNRS